MVRYPDKAKDSNASQELTAIYEEHHKFKLAIDLLVRWRDALPKDDTMRLELAHRIAEDYAAMGDEEKSAEVFAMMRKSIFKDSPYRLSGLAKLGEYYEKKFRWVEALEIYEDLANSASQPGWSEAAKSRLKIVREKLYKTKIEVSSYTAPGGGR